MNDPFGMCGGQPIRDRQGDIEGLAPGQASLASQPLAERLALQKLRDRVVDVAFRTEGEDGQNMRMGERRQGLRLAFEALDGLGILGEAFGKHLDRHVAVELGILGAVNFSHPACTERRNDLVPSEPGSRS